MVCIPTVILFPDCARRTAGSLSSTLRWFPAGCGCWGAAASVGPTVSAAPPAPTRCLCHRGSSHPSLHPVSLVPLHRQHPARGILNRRLVSSDHLQHRCVEVHPASVWQDPLLGDGVVEQVHHQALAAAHAAVDVNACRFRPKESTRAAQHPSGWTRRRASGRAGPGIHSHAQPREAAGLISLPGAEELLTLRERRRCRRRAHLPLRLLQPPPIRQGCELLRRQR